jgi:spermidine/putrescine transport system ATP-binding protein
MNKGHILQVGSPHDIYLRPSERFVANFIGDTNFLKARTVSAKGGKVKLELANGGSLHAEMPPEGISVGEVTVVVRPENAAICDAKKGDFAGLVENIVYFGTDTHIHLKLIDGSPFIIRQQNAGGAAAPVKVGDKVGIAVAPGTPRIIRD